jgi:hypothetical protein
VAAAVAWLAAATLVTRSPVRAPGPALPVLTALALAVVVLKLVLDAHHLANGAWLSLGLAAAFAGCQLAPAPRPRAGTRDGGV